MNFNQRSRSILKGLFNDNNGRQNENLKHIDIEDMVYTMDFMSKQSTLVDLMLQ